MEKLELNAYAKINLCLQILNKRVDGYHNINTIFRKIDLYDKITISPSDRLCIHTIPDIAVPARDNLVYIAISRLFTIVPEGNYKAEIEVKKNIPLSSGLGGGSSDAGTILVGLNQFWNLQLSEKDLLDVAEKIGADVPFFLFPGKTAQASGKGEILDFFELELPYHILLIYPNIKISTVWAYRKFSELNERTAPVDFKTILLENIKKPEVLREQLFNDFEKVVFAEYPILSEIKSKLYNYGSVFALLSGSGSSIFGLFETEEKLKKAKEEFKSLQVFEV